MVRWLEVGLVPALYVAFWILYASDKKLYRALAEEDSWIEDLTIVLLFAAGLIATRIAWRLRSIQGRYWLFFLMLGFGLVLGALEEISWGQRIFGLESPEFFLKHSDQKEINLHNAAQNIFGLKTRHIVGGALLLYGGLLPLLSSWPAIGRMLHRFQIPVPPRFLVPSFVCAFPLMLDWPSSRSEEYGEFLYSLCLLLFVMWWGRENIPAPRSGLP